LTLGYQEIGDESGREIVNEIDDEIVVEEVVPRILAIEAQAALVAWTDRCQSAYFYLKRILDREERPDMDSLETCKNQTKDFDRMTPSFVLVCPWPWPWPCEAYSYSYSCSYLVEVEMQVLQNCPSLTSHRWSAFDRLLALALVMVMAPQPQPQLPWVWGWGWG
jgi:hypothetical protein